MNMFVNSLRDSQNLSPSCLQGYNYPSAFFVFLFFLPAIFLVRLSWQALLILTHAQTTLTVRWIRCHHRSRWLAWFLVYVKNVVFVWDTRQLPKASYLSGVQFIQLYSACPLSMFRFRRCTRVRRQPGNAVWSFSYGRYSFCPRWSSVSIVLLSSVQTWTVLQAWNLDLWRHPCT